MTQKEKPLNPRSDQTGKAKGPVKSKFFQIAFSIVLFIILFLFSFFLAYYKTVSIKPPPTNYSECIDREGSIIQEGHPSVCVTKDGIRFVQEVDIQEESEGQLCGGSANIACPQGYFCQLEGDYPNAAGVCIKN